MHLPSASQISCSITMGLREMMGKLCYTRKVQSRNSRVNGIFKMCACVCVLSLHIEYQNLHPTAKRGHFWKVRTFGLVLTLKPCLKVKI